MRTCLLGALVLAVIWGGPVWAQEPALSGSLGIELVFTPLPPATLDVTSVITLALTFGRAEVISRTELSIAGLVAEHLTMGVNLNGVGLRSGMRFDPCFSKYWFEVHGRWCPLELGGLFLVENLAPTCQTPSFTVGLVLDVGVIWRPGFFARGLTGIGVRNLLHLVDLDPATDLLAAPGWWFEEMLIHIGFTSPCFLLDSLFLFDPGGLAWLELGGSYRYPDPEAELGARIRLNGSFGLDWAKLSLGVRVPPVAVRLVTTFNLAGFVAQELGVEVFFSWVRIYSQTQFDFTGLIRAIVGVELKI